MVTLENYGRTVTTYVQYLARTNSSDVFVMNEHDYDVCDFSKDDVWLDLGAYIGDFALKYANRVKRIISVEPERENCILLMCNMALNKIYNFELRQQLVTATRAGNAFLYMNAKENKAKHSMYRKRYGQSCYIEAIPFDHLVIETGANKVKMDIEGGELAILKASKVLHSLDELIFEFHYDNDIVGQDHKHSFELRDLLRKHFVHVNVCSEDKPACTMIIHAHKNKSNATR